MFEVNTAVKLLIDPQDGRIVDANAAAVSFYGWSPSELRAMRVTDINTLPEAAVHEEMRRRALREALVLPVRAPNRLRRGATRRGAHRAGEPRRSKPALLIVHDVTDRDAFEEQLRRAQRLETVGRLAGGVAHDFNNLLTIMTGSCGLMCEACRRGPPPFPSSTT